MSDTYRNYKAAKAHFNRVTARVRFHEDMVAEALAELESAARAMSDAHDAHMRHVYEARRALV